MNNPKSLLNYMSLANKMKTTMRWTHTSKRRRESSAEHSWSLAVFAMVVLAEQDFGLDGTKVMKMCLVHDIAESITGDYDAYQVEVGNLSREEKQQRELDAVKQLKRNLPTKSADELYEIWLEYEHKETREAKFVAALDKIDTVYQMTLYDGQLAEEGHVYLGTYGNRQVSDFPELSELMSATKKTLKKGYEKHGLAWDTSYDQL